MAFLWLVHGGDPNYLLTGMILQVPSKERVHIPPKWERNSFIFPFLPLDKIFNQEMKLRNVAIIHGSVEK